MSEEVVIHEHFHYVMRQSWLSGLLKRFNSDPRLQYKIHLVMTYVWVVNMIAAVCVYAFAPHIWSVASILYLVLISLYANFATDYGAVPGSEAAITAADLSITYKKDDLWLPRRW